LCLLRNRDSPAGAGRIVRGADLKIFSFFFWLQFPSGQRVAIKYLLTADTRLKKVLAYGYQRQRHLQPYCVGSFV
jgi:hypothetical protein